MQEALASLGLEPDVRAERISPEQFLHAGAGARAVSVLRTLAPAKVNLGLFVGPVRDGDGRHELVSVMQSLSLADELTPGARYGHRGGAGDEVVCPGVPGRPRTTSPRGRWPPSARPAAGGGRRVRLHVHKRIPLAAGLAGGSADAAAALRLAARASGVEDPDADAGAGGRARGRRQRPAAPGAVAGRRRRGAAASSCPRPRGAGVLLLPFEEGLATARVYQEADRLGAPRTPAELDRLRRALRNQLGWGATLPSEPRLLEQRPPGGRDLAVPGDRARARGAPRRRRAARLRQRLGADRGGAIRGTARLGPALERAARSLGSRRPAVIACTPVDERAGAVLESR